VEKYKRHHRRIESFLRSEASWRRMVLLRGGDIPSILVEMLCYEGDHFVLSDFKAFVSYNGREKPSRDFFPMEWIYAKGTVEGTVDELIEYIAVSAQYRQEKFQDSLIPNLLRSTCRHLRCKRFAQSTDPARVEVSWSFDLE
jgi:hypothetical protein